MSPTALRQTLEALWQDVFQDPQYPALLSGAIGKAKSLAREAEVQALCTHAGQPVERICGSLVWKECPQCGKELSREIIR